jgi:C4-dicarboxylate-specific signal transduction histidine kinase
LAARYGGRYEEVKEHLDDAKTWYDQTRPQAEVVADQIEQKRSQLDEKLGDAGVAIAKKERRIREILSELLRTAADHLREKERPSK